MTNLSLEQTEATAAPVTRRRSRIPGLATMRATSGFQRGVLVAGLVLVGIFVIMALFAPLIATYDFDASSDGDRQFIKNQPPSADHWFGTTNGRTDVFSEVIYGAQTALQVIVLAVAISLVIGVPLGLVSGYIGGWLDRILVLVTDALFAFPSLLLAIVVSTTVSTGQSTRWGGILAAAISITVVYVPQYFRVVRNATVAAREESYVEAARAIGAPPRVIMIRYVFGNVVQTVPVIATLNAGDAILTLAGLGFLGYGIEPTAAPEWGRQLNVASDLLINDDWWGAVFPGLAIVLIVLGVTLVGESLNDVLNPVLRTRKITQVVLPPLGGKTAAPADGADVPTEQSRKELR